MKIKQTADGHMNVVVYSKDECPACNNLRHFLAQNRQDFVEYKIGRSVTIDEVVSYGVKSVPVVRVTSDEGSQIFVGSGAQFTEWWLKNDERLLLED